MAWSHGENEELRMWKKVYLSKNKGLNRRVMPSERCQDRVREYMCEREC